MSKIRPKECQNVEFKCIWKDEYPKFLKRGVEAQRIPKSEHESSTKDVLDSLGLDDDDGKM